MKKSVLTTTLSIFLINIVFFMTIFGGNAISQTDGTDAGPVFIANPNPLYFDDTYVASRSQKTLSFFNAGDADLVITNAVFDGPFETYNSFPITVPAGTPFDQVIQFTPFEVGAIVGSVTYTSNDPVNPSLEVSLRGICIDDPINGWEWIYTGFNYILFDLEFPEGQDQIGYTVGMNNTMGQIGIMLKSTDGGDTWDQISEDGIAGVETCSFPTLETGYAAGWDDDILKTTDGGQTWQSVSVVSNVFYYSSIEFKDENNGVIIVKPSADPYTAYYTSDGGATWTEGSGCEAFEDVTWAGGDTWYATGYEKVCKSTDNGATWTTVYTQGALLIGADFLTPDYGIAAGDYGQIITTKDGGDTWEEDAINDILFKKPFIWDNDTAYVVGTPEYVYKTTDAGQTWVSDFAGNWQKALYAVTFTDNYTGFICGGSNGIVLRKKPGLVEECQDYSFNTGWNSISSYVNPFTPDVEELFAPIVDDIILFRNLTQVWWPEEEINTIGDFNNGSGYALKLSADAEFSICGEDFATNELMLQPGWSYMPTLSQCPANAMDMFGENLDDIIIIQDLIGTDVFWPAQGIFSLEYLDPGKAYKAKIANAFTVTFPDCDGKDATVPAISQANNISTVWGTMNMTPSTEVVAFTKSATTNFIQGDVIGVFGQNSQPFGYMVVNGTGAQAITLFGDDVTSIEQDGFTEGETVSYKLYRAQSGETFDLSVEYESTMDNTSGNFHVGSFAAIKSITMGVTGIGSVEGSNIDVYPNPARNIINVDGMDMQSLVITNYHGQLIYQNNDPKTSNTIQTDGMSSGLYILKVETSTGIRIEKIVIEK